MTLAEDAMMDAARHRPRWCTAPTRPSAVRAILHDILPVSDRAGS